MSNKAHDTTRRDFISSSGKIALATGAAAALAGGSTARADEPKPLRREIVPGSPTPSYSRAVKLGQLVYVAGCVGRYKKDGKDVLDPGFRAQARQVLLNLKASVEAAGSSMDKLLKCTCFIKEQSDFAAFNEVYRSIIPEPRPARSTVVVKDLVAAGALLEVDCVCYVA